VSAVALFTKKGLIGYNHFGRLGSLMEQAAREEPRGLELLQAECQALEACVRKVPNFAHVSAQQMQQTVENAMRKTCAAGELLLKEGDFSSNMLYIHTGSVAVSSASKGFIAQIYQGNVVGHHSYIYRRPRTATVHAAKEQNVQLIYYEFMFQDTPLERPDARSPSVGSSALHSAPSPQPSSSKADNAPPPPFIPATHSFKRASMPALPSVDEGALRAIHLYLYSFCTSRTLQPLVFAAPQSLEDRLVSKFISNRHSIAAIESSVASNSVNSRSGMVSVSEGDVEAELQKSEDMAALNKVQSGSARCFCVFAICDASSTTSLLLFPSPRASALQP
jgi:hypothetical protein